jgi:hypothetical protein
LPVAQAVPADRLPKSTQACVPDAQLVIPVMHEVGFVEQFAFAVQVTQAPEPLQTMFVPQLAPLALSLPSTQL